MDARATCIVGSGRLDKFDGTFYTVTMMYGAYNFQGFYTMTRIRQV